MKHICDIMLYCHMATRAGIQAEQDLAPNKLTQKSLPDRHIQLGLISQNFLLTY